MEDEPEENNTPASMLSYHEQKDERVWLWLSNRAINPAYLDVEAGEDPDAFSAEPWLPRGRNA